ncbi:hypothetical protein OVX87_31955 [Klebsiella pneumoniae]|nr:hypothetical protein [Klebsiella pneumoniae]
MQIDYVESAIDGLQYELEGLGLVHERRVKKPNAGRKHLTGYPRRSARTALLTSRAMNRNLQKQNSLKIMLLQRRRIPTRTPGDTPGRPLPSLIPPQLPYRPLPHLTYHMTPQPVRRRTTMNLLLYKAPTMMTPTFNARISGNHLIASLNDDTPIFSLNVSEDPSFWIEGAR